MLYAIVVLSSDRVYLTDRPVFANEGDKWDKRINNAAAPGSRIITKAFHI